MDEESGNDGSLEDGHTDDVRIGDDVFDPAGESDSDKDGKKFALFFLCIFIFKDGAYFCYCAYVLRISRYSGFLWVTPTIQGYFCAV